VADADIKQIYDMGMSEFTVLIKKVGKKKKGTWITNYLVVFWSVCTMDTLLSLRPRDRICEWQWN